MLHDLARFASPLLNGILDRELDAGNTVVEDGPGWGEMHRLMMLAGPFQTARNEIDPRLSYREVNDRHYWLAEIEDPLTRELLACRFPASL